MERTTGQAITTLSTGDVAIANVEKRSTKVLQTWKAHDLEAWCGAWKDPNVVLTGGDDALLKLWDLRDADGKAAIQNKRYLLLRTENLTVAMMRELYRFYQLQIRYC
jgi:hypothetical protein